MTDFFIGGVVGSLQVLGGHPLDTMKTYLQTDNFKNLKFKPSTLYRGVKYPLISNTVINSSIFGINEFVYRETNNYWTSGFISGSITSIIINPVELYKVRGQLGISGNINLTKGLYPTIMRESLATSIYFGTYFNLVDMYGPLISGGCAGLFSWTFTYPIDVIKSRIQSNHCENIQDSIKQGNLWKGYSFCAIRAIFANSISFYAYNYLKNQI